MPNAAAGGSAGVAVGNDIGVQGAPRFAVVASGFMRGEYRNHKHSQPLLG